MVVHRLTIVGELLDGVFYQTQEQPGCTLGIGCHLGKDHAELVAASCLHLGAEAQGKCGGTPGSICQTHGQVAVLYHLSVYHQPGRSTKNAIMVGARIIF